MFLLPGEYPAVAAYYTRRAWAASGKKGIPMKNQAFNHRLRYAVAGIREAFGAENSFRLQCIAATGVLIALLVLRPAPIWWAMAALSVSVVLAAEQFNTALERLADRLHPEVHPEIRIAKDCAAGAVLVVSLGALAVAAAFIVSRVP